MYAQIIAGAGIAKRLGGGCPAASLGQRGSLSRPHRRSGGARLLRAALRLIRFGAPRCAAGAESPFTAKASAHRLGPIENPIVVARRTHRRRSEPTTVRAAKHVFCARIVLGRYRLATVADEADAILPMAQVFHRS
jgi:hypothetical protein